MQYSTFTVFIDHISSGISRSSFLHSGLIVDITACKRNAARYFAKGDRMARSRGMLNGQFITETSNCAPYHLIINALLIYLS